MAKSPPLTIGYLPILDHLILGVAARFNHQLALTTEQFPNLDTLSDALEAGTLHGAFILFPMALELYRRSPDWQVVLLGHREGQTLTVRPGIETANDFKNQTVHVPHRFSTHYILLAQFLTTHGLSIDTDVKFEFGYHDIHQAIDELTARDVRAFLSAEPIGTAARRQSWGTTLSLSRDIYAHHIDCVLVMRKDYITEHLAVVQSFIDELVKAGMFTNAYPRQATEIGEKFLGWPRKLLLEALTHSDGHILYWDLVPRLEDFEMLQDEGVRFGLWPEAITLTDFIRPEFAYPAYRDWVIDTRREVKDRGQATTLPANLGEAAGRLRDGLGAARCVGLHVTATGAAYPKDISRADETCRDGLKTALAGTPVTLTNLTPYKGVTLIPPGDSHEFERVVLELDEAQLQRCLVALGYGHAYPIQHVSLLEDLLRSSKPAVFLQHNQMILLSLPWKMLRFLVLALGYWPSVS